MCRGSRRNCDKATALIQVQPSLTWRLARSLLSGERGHGGWPKMPA